MMDGIHELYASKKQRVLTKLTHHEKIYTHFSNVYTIELAIGTMDSTES